MSSRSNMSYRSNGKSFSTTVEDELVDFNNYFRHFPSNISPTFIFGGNFAPMAQKCIRYFTSIFDLGYFWITVRNEQHLCVCRLDDLKPDYLKNFKKNALFTKDDSECIDPLNLYMFVLRSTNSLKSKRVQDDLGLRNINYNWRDGSSSQSGRSSLSTNSRSSQSKQSNSSSRLNASVSNVEMSEEEYDPRYEITDYECLRISIFKDEAANKSLIDHYASVSRKYPENQKVDNNVRLSDAPRFARLYPQLDLQLNPDAIEYVPDTTSNISDTQETSNTSPRLESSGSVDDLDNPYSNLSSINNFQIVADAVQEFVMGNPILVHSAINMDNFRFFTNGMLEHIIEIYDIPSTVKTVDVQKLFPYEEFVVKWCDESHALLIFRHAERARFIHQEFGRSRIHSRLIENASPLSTLVICLCNIPAILDGFNHK